MANTISAHPCPKCHQPASTTIDAFTCWNSHEPRFWDRMHRSEIAEVLGCKGPRVSQMITALGGGKRKQYIHKEG